MYRSKIGLPRNSQGGGAGLLAAENPFPMPFIRRL